MQYYHESYGNVHEHISPRFVSNSEDYASELLENQCLLAEVIKHCFDCIVIS